MIFNEGDKIWGLVLYPPVVIGGILLHVTNQNCAIIKISQSNDPIVVPLDDCFKNPEEKRGLITRLESIISSITTIVDQLEFE